VQVPGASFSPRTYRRLVRKVVLSTAVVAFVPLLIITVINTLQYRQAIQDEHRKPISRLTSNSKRAVEFFLQERESALRMIVNNQLVGGSCDKPQLEAILRALQKSLPFGAVVDLGIIDDQGDQRCYAGPYELLGKNYKEQEWFRRVSWQGVYVSDVFLGHRQSPHFVLAIRYEGDDGRDFILRATIDSKQLHEQLLLVGLRPISDIFIINREGMLQSPSRRYGEVLQKAPLPVPLKTGSTEVVELQDSNGNQLIVGYAYIQHSPFILMLVTPTAEVLGAWSSMQLQLFGLLIICAVVILLVILVMSRKLVRSLRESDRARVQVFERMEYTNKLSTVGRLAAGVAHEINNPMAIINQKAGLLNDRVTMGGDFPGKDRVLKSIGSLLKSVDRCRAITHRLLGFAKHIEARREDIDLEKLLGEVLGFLEKEIAYRGVTVDWKIQQDLPDIKSDRGQLQQVFLNIINNALAAVKADGRIQIAVRRVDDSAVAVIIEDNGEGIPPENLKRIFEPFFTTKPGEGTGLGLSVTYGIVEKLGGDIKVESQVGSGTRFFVILPRELERRKKPRGDDQFGNG
jgi:signal transduction histidine kinase